MRTYRPKSRDHEYNYHAILPLTICKIRQWRASELCLFKAHTCSRAFLRLTLVPFYRLSLILQTPTFLTGFSITNLSFQYSFSSIPHTLFNPDLK